MHGGSKLRFSPSSTRDIREASDYYKKAGPDLERDFLDELAITLGAVSRHPLAFQTIYKQVRRARLRKFPYGVFFRERNGLLRVIAVVDLRRDPSTWQRRA